MAECEQAIAALWDETGSASWHMRQLLTRVEALERSMRHVEAVTHKALNPGEQEGDNSLDDIAARLRRLESMFQSLMYAGMAFAETDAERYKMMAAYGVHQAFHGPNGLLNPGEQEGEQPVPTQDRAVILSDFYAEVCREAEGIMAQSGMVSGAHWNAMRRVLQRHGVEVNE